MSNFLQLSKKLYSSELESKENQLQLEQVENKSEALFETRAATQPTKIRPPRAKNRRSPYPVPVESAAPVVEFDHSQPPLYDASLYDGGGSLIHLTTFAYPEERYNRPAVCPSSLHGFVPEYYTGREEERYVARTDMANFPGYSPTSSGELDALVTTQDPFCRDSRSNSAHDSYPFSNQSESSTDSELPPDYAPRSSPEDTPVSPVSPEVAYKSVIMGPGSPSTYCDPRTLYEEVPKRYGDVYADFFAACPAEEPRDVTEQRLAEFGKTLCGAVPTEARGAYTSVIVDAQQYQMTNGFVH